MNEVEKEMKKLVYVSDKKRALLLKALLTIYENHSSQETRIQAFL